MSGAEQDTLITFVAFYNVLSVVIAVATIGAIIWKAVSWLKRTTMDQLNDMTERSKLELAARIKMSEDGILDVNELIRQKTIEIAEDIKEVKDTTKDQTRNLSILSDNISDHIRRGDAYMMVADRVIADFDLAKTKINEQQREIDRIKDALRQFSKGSSSSSFG